LTLECFYGDGRRKERQRQEQLWVTHTELAEGPGHPFYKRLNEVLDGEKFDEFCERECAQYAKNNGSPSSERWNIQTKRGKENW
jgi:hypothetical protein